MGKNPLLDKEFLLRLDQEHNREMYAKIIALDLNELPLEQIEGRVTGGSLNIDGTSAIRRTCSLSLVGQDLLITEPYWALKCKFKLEIGLANHIDPQYSDIIWFKQGIYGITSFSMSESTSGFTVNISGKDKMAYLNGDLGGNIFAQHDFGSYDQIETNGDITNIKLKIYDIIRQAVHEYGQEPFYNIIINDLDPYGYELWDYKGSYGNNISAPMFYLYTIDTKELRNMEFNPNRLVYYEEDGETKSTALKDIPYEKFFVHNELITQNEIGIYKMSPDDDAKQYYITRIDHGEVAGYHGTDLVYAGDLILNAGETITSLLDKIKNMLGEFEYFYDVDGRFIFQKKKTYVQGLFSPLINGVIYPTMTISQYAYKFEDSELITTYSNNPAIGDIKNDFAVWGTRKSVSGVDLPIHARYAIMHKPKIYQSLGHYEGTIVIKDQALYKYDEISGYIPITYDEAIILNKPVYIYIAPKEFKAVEYDWRELIYQMAIDFYSHNSEPDFIQRLQQNNSWVVNGKTGYEPFYADMQAFWRQIYDPAGTIEKGFINDINNPYNHWHTSAVYYPENLTFWIDFLDTYGELNNYSIETIGHRPKVENANGVTAIAHKETPEVEFKIIGEDGAEQGNLALTVMQVPKSNKELFTTSSQGISTMNKIDELIYKHVCMAEGITINAIPIFYLEPNVRIYAHSEKSKIDGDYIVSRISLPLTYNGTMSIIATKVINQLN